MLSDFCGLENVLVFVCIQTRLWSGLVFVLLVALSDVYILGNCLCSAGEKGSPAGVPGQLWLSGAICLLQERAQLFVFPFLPLQRRAQCLELRNCVLHNRAGLRI